MSAASTEPGLDLGAYARVARRRWYVIVLAGVVGLALAWVYLAIQPRQATASALVNVTVISQEPFELVREPSGLIDAQTETQTVRSSAVMSRAAQELGGVTPAELRAGLEAELYADATVVRITYTADTVADATAGADEVADQFLAYRAELAADRVDATVDRMSERRDLLRDDLLRVDQELASATPGSRQALQAQADRDVLRAELDGLLTQMTALGGIDTTAGWVLTAASDVGAFVTPSAGSVLPVGLLVGLLLGLVLAFARDALDRRVRDEADVARAGGGPVLVRLPGGATVPPRPEERDALRSVWEQLVGRVAANHPVLSLVELSATPGGVPDVAANLACTLADAGNEVELVVVGVPRDGIRDLEDRLALRMVGEDADGVDLTAPALPGLRVRWVASDPLHPDRVASLQRRLVDRDRTPVTVVAVAAQASRAARLTAARLSDATVLVVVQGHDQRAVLRQTSADVAAVAGAPAGSVVVRGRRSLRPPREEQGPAPTTATVEPQTPAGVGAGER